MKFHKDPTIKAMFKPACNSLTLASAFFLLIGLCGNNLLAQPRDEGGVAQPKTATLLKVEFPLNAESESRLMGSLERIASRPIGNDRPVVILEFTQEPATVSNRDKQGKPIGFGTTFERALGIARWLSGPKGGRIRSIAYIPNPICGHAVLVALASEEIAIATNATIGEATINETEVDATMRQAYLDAAKRSSFPSAAVLAMIDPNETLFRIAQKGDGNSYRYTTAKEYERLENDIDDIENANARLTVPNQLATFVGLELRSAERRWVAHTANDRDQLSQSLKLARPISQRVEIDGPRVAIRVHLTGIISTRQVNRIIRAVEEGLKDPSVNTILFEVDSAGGNLSESIRFAQYFSNLPNDRVSTVCYIRNAARGDAALLALCCDLIYMHPDARLGGPGEATITPEICNEQKTSLQDLAKAMGRSDGELLVCVCPEMPVFEFNTFDGQMQLNNPEWIVDDPVVNQWERGKQVRFAEGLTYENASEINLASDNPLSLEDVGARFGIKELPPEIQSNKTQQFVEWLGRQGWFSMLLFLVGIVCLSAELSTPGVTLPGILAAICFGLFFWIHLFQGTVEWLEVLLILGGALCLAMELFVLPGFGVFGVTGLVLLAVGLLLAGQTFVIPTNRYQWERTSQSIGQLGLLVVSLFAAAVIFRKQLANLPMIRWFALQPPKMDRELLEKEQLEEGLRSLIGWYGTTVSRCNPSGKAMIGDRIYSVVSSTTWLDEDTEVEVESVHENALVVKPRVS